MRSRFASFAVLIVLGIAPAVAQEVAGRVRETWQSVSGGGAEHESLLQSYELGFRNRVSEDVHWQARLRALISGFAADEGEPRDTTLLEPFVQVVYEGASWQASGGARAARLRPESGSIGPDRLRRDLFGRMSWSAERRPHVDWSISRIDLEEEAGRSTTDDRSLFTLSQGGALGHLSLGIENRRLEDRRTLFRRDGAQASLNADLRHAFADGRVVVGGQALLVEGRTTDAAPGALLVDVRRQARAGLFAIDPSPLSGALAATPALVDGDLSAPAADLSGEFRNLGVDLGFPATVDAALMHLERRLLPGSADDYLWDVYTSVDGEFWEPAAVAVRGVFDDLLNRFEIRFPGATARFLKVVDTRFSRDEPPLAVTEIELFGREARAGEQRLSDSRRSGNVSLHWQAGGNVDVGLNVFANRQTVDAAAALPRSDQDVNSALSATFRPGAVTTTVRLQSIDRSSTLAPPERDRSATLGFAVSPLPALDLSLSGTLRRNASPDEVLVRASGVAFRGAARFLHDTELALDLSLLRQDEGPLQRILTRKGANLSLISTLRPGVVLSNNWNVERLEYAGAASFPARTDLDLRSRIAYRPTRVLGVAFEYLHQEIAGLRGNARLYDVDWLPFPGGALQLQFTMARDRRSITGSLRDETRLGARWTLNPAVRLDLAYGVLRSGDAGAARQELATAFVEYRF